MLVWEKPPGGDRNGISTLNFLDWKNQNHVFQAMAASRGDSVTLTGAGEPVQLAASRVSAPYFDIFGVRAVLGRTFAADEDQAGKSQVVILSHRLWESRFGADPKILGAKLTLNGQPCTVIGVLPALLSLFIFKRLQEPEKCPWALTSVLASLVRVSSISRLHEKQNPDC